MKSPKSVKMLEELGRVQLSKNFFMRDFLYSEISQIEGIPNIPDHPDLAIEAGKKLCEEVLEPIQAQFGRVSIRSAYRSCAVNGKGADNKNQFNCARNEANYANHIWDYRDKNGHMGATACIVVNSVLPYYNKTGDWQALALWIHDNVPGYSSMCFFPKLSAFNISWHEKPQKVVSSHIAGSKGKLIFPDMDGFNDDHSHLYHELIESLKI